MLILDSNLLFWANLCISYRTCHCSSTRQSAWDFLGNVTYSWFSLFPPSAATTRTDALNPRWRHYVLCCTSTSASFKSVTIPRPFLSHCYAVSFV